MHKADIQHMKLDANQRIKILLIDFIDQLWQHQNVIIMFTK